MLFINWTRKPHKCHNTVLLPFLEEVLRILDMFDSFSLEHVYMERNSKDNALSKAGQCPLVCL